MGWRCKRCEIFLLGIAWPRSLTLSSGTLKLFEHLMLRTGTRKEGGHENCVFRTHMVENEHRGCSEVVQEILIGAHIRLMPRRGTKMECGDVYNFVPWWSSLLGQLKTPHFLKAPK